MLTFPEISTTASGWSYPTPPLELRSNFFKFIKEQMKQGHDYIVITFSTIVFDLIRLAAHDLNIHKYKISDKGTLVLENIFERSK